MNKQPTSIDVVWFKRDLRLQDHAPLKTAIDTCKGDTKRPLLLLYCFEPSVIANANYDQRHWRFVYESLTDLNQQLADLHYKNLSQDTHKGPFIWVFYREVLDVLSAIQTQFTIHTLYSHQETGLKITFNRDKEIAKFCQKQEIIWLEFPSDAVVRGKKRTLSWEKRWEKTMQAPQQNPDLHRFFPAAVSSQWFEDERGSNLPIEWQTPHPHFQPGGERSGQRYLASFLTKRMAFYEESISKPLESRRGCSRLSPYLAWGCLSARQVYQAYFYRTHTLKEANPSALFIARLRARTYFIQQFEANDRIEFENKSKAFDKIIMNKNVSHFKAWCEGKTGFPIVDACMRCLIATGYLNFRMRALLISFLTHHLFQHWQLGGQHLARMFTDFEPGIHYAQIQLQSGMLGSTRQPIRIYNPVKQSQEHDPEGIFIKQWVPELANCPITYIHTPWEIPMLEQEMLNLRIGDNYPTPIIDIKHTFHYAQKQLYKNR